MPRPPQRMAGRGNISKGNEPHTLQSTSESFPKTTRSTLMGRMAERGTIPPAVALPAASARIEKAAARLPAAPAEPKAKACGLGKQKIPIASKVPMGCAEEPMSAIFSPPMKRRCAPAHESGSEPRSLKRLRVKSSPAVEQLQGSPHGASLAEESLPRQATVPEQCRPPPADDPKADPHQSHQCAKHAGAPPMPMPGTPLALSSSKVGGSPSTSGALARATRQLRWEKLRMGEAESGDASGASASIAAPAAAIVVSQAAGLPKASKSKLPRARKVSPPASIVGTDGHCDAPDASCSTFAGSLEVQHPQPMTPYAKANVTSPTAAEQMRATPSPISTTPLTLPGLMTNTAAEKCALCRCDAAPGSACCLAGSQSWYCASCLGRVLGSNPAKTQDLPAKPPVASSAPAKPISPSSSSQAVVYSSELETCALCCHETAPKCAIRLACSHGWYCAFCLQRHAEMRMDQGHIDVGCPECSTPLPEHTLRAVLPANVMKRLVSQSLERAVCAEGDLFSCPTPDCAMRVALDPGDVSQLKCPLCRKCSCVRCGVQPYHKGMSCEEYSQRKSEKASDIDTLLQWMKDTGSKQCPKCQMVVTKQNLDKQTTQHAECHKMQCRSCSTQFCFKCLAVLSATYTCGCSRDAHGFVDPRTGRRIQHLRAPKANVKRGGAPRR